jgi:hypothetical protein
MGGKMPISIASAYLRMAMNGSNVISEPSGSAAWAFLKVM